MDRRDELGAPVAVVRIEQLYPWPEEQILAMLEQYPARDQVWWVQEEPANMGAWNYVHGGCTGSCATGPSSATSPGRRARSPASGSAAVHDREQEQLLADAFADLA